MVPATALKLSDVAKGTFGTFRGQQTAYTWFTPESRKVSVKVTGGLIAHYRDRGNVRISLFSPDEVSLEPVAQNDSVPPDGREYEVVLKSPHSGLHRLEWSDGGDRTSIAWPENQPMTMRSSLDEPAQPQGRWTLNFYVPEGTETVGGFSTGASGNLCDADGKVVFDFATMTEPGYFDVPVSDGQDGHLWHFENCAGSRMLMTVPPYLARNGKELLLPREVVETDKQ